MGELINRESSKSPQEFSGERLTGAVGGQVEIEHYHRYLLARHYCRGLDVLDIASGEGYGSAFIAQVAKSVVGVEIDEGAVYRARREFQRSNLSFEQGDARSIPLKDASVDVVISFETLEHIAEHDEFFAEIKRVLRPSGFIIISTPDAQVYSPVGSTPNPFHILELSNLDFRILLKKYFSNFEISSQRSFMGSVIIPDTSGASVITFENRSATTIESNNGLAHAPYLLAFASDVTLPQLSSSLFVSRNDLDTDFRVRIEAEYAKIEAQQALENLKSEISIMKSKVRLRLQMAERRMLKAEREEKEIRIRADILEQQQSQALQQQSQLLAQNAELRVRQDFIAQELTRALALLSKADMSRADVEHQLEPVMTSLICELQRLQQIERSSAWQVTRPLRKMGVRFPRLATLLRRLAKLGWWTVTLQLRARYNARKNRQKKIVLENKKSFEPGPLSSPNLESPPEECSSDGRTGPSEQAFYDDIIFEIGDSFRAMKIGMSPYPDVTIIISTYGQLATTIDCLLSIGRSKTNSSLEIFVVDDGYQGQENMTVLKKIEGLNFITNSKNIGYLLSCNSAAGQANGRYLYFLNNDTELGLGSIDSLVAFLDSHNNAGVVGSKLIYPDGRLQEAGGIVWRDASAWNYGKGQDPNRPDFCYVRQVDYCSGASLMTRRKLFLSLGGFDVAFAPAYYEDCDFAFRVRARGFKVYFQPSSVVIHKEGVSHGVDINVGGKRHQKSNQAVMRERWSEILDKEHFANGEQVLRARDNGRNRKTILIIDHYTLEPDRDAGSRSVIGIVEALVDAGWIVKFWPVNRVFSPQYNLRLEQNGVEVLDSRWPGDLRTWLFSNGDQLDHVLVNRPNYAIDRLVDLLPLTSAVLSFYGVDLHANRMHREARLEQDLVLEIEADEMENLERSVWPYFDISLYPSEEEAEMVRQKFPSVLSRSIVPFYADFFPNRVMPPSNTKVLFVAGFAHPPNVDAAIFLVERILPLLKSHLPDVKVTLAGSNPTKEVEVLANDDVTVTGYISDSVLGELYNSHRVSVVPLRFGAGVKGKVVESLAYGLPIVTTSIGIEGIPGARNIVPVCNEAASIADAVMQLINDDDVWLRQSKVQQEFAQRVFSRRAMQKSIITALEMAEVAARPRLSRVSRRVDGEVVDFHPSMALDLS